MLQVRRQKVCVCVCVCVCVLTKRSWSLSTSSLHYEVKEKKYFLSLRQTFLYFFSKREHWYLVVCVCVCVFSCSIVSDALQSHDCSLPGSSVHGIFPARILEWVVISSSRDVPDSRIEPTSPALQVESLLLSDQKTCFFLNSNV